MTKIGLDASLDMILWLTIPARLGIILRWSLRRCGGLPRYRKSNVVVDVIDLHEVGIIFKQIRNVGWNFLSFYLSLFDFVDRTENVFIRQLRIGLIVLLKNYKNLLRRRERHAGHLLYWVSECNELHLSRVDISNPDLMTYSHLTKT